MYKTLDNKGQYTVPLFCTALYEYIYPEYVFGIHWKNLYSVVLLNKPTVFNVEIHVAKDVEIRRVVTLTSKHKLNEKKISLRKNTNRGAPLKNIYRYISKCNTVLEISMKCQMQSLMVEQVYVQATGSTTKEVISTRLDATKATDPTPSLTHLARRQVNSCDYHFHSCSL